jgi:DNA repair photolyase
MKNFKSLKGRGASSRPDPRFLQYQREAFDDGWANEDTISVEAIAGQLKLRTEILVDHSKTIISRNQSPDVPFSQSINPYKGCEHGCSYCFARPTHAYLDLSPGLDFETKIFCKPNAAALLEQALSKPNYQVSPIGLGANTDAYQPVERKLGITRDLLKVLKTFQHPLAIITKSSLVERDIDLLAPMAELNLVKVIVSVTTLDHELSRKLEPRAATPKRRLSVIRSLTDAGIPVGILLAPIIPALNDSEIEAVLSAAVEAGAMTASYVMLRLPHELKDLFAEWLQAYYPLKAAHIMNVVRDMRGGQAYSSVYGERMTGTGEFARLVAQRFQLACKNTGLNQRSIHFNLDAFTVPEKSGDQMSLF